MNRGPGVTIRHEGDFRAEHRNGSALMGHGKRMLYGKNRRHWILPFLGLLAVGVVDGLGGKVAILGT